MTNDFWQMWTLMLEGASRDILAHLESTHLEPILLKGPTIASWIYDDPGDRMYTDIDVLVAPHRREEAIASLAEIGFRPAIDESMLRTSSTEELSLVDDDRRVTIDLHTSLKGVRATPESAWKVLDEVTVPFGVLGVTTRALAEPARAMHLALHLCQRGLVDTKAATDLAHGLVRLDRETWYEAAQLAHEIGAIGAFFAGMALLPEGVAVLESMHISPPTDRETRMRAASATSSALFLERVASATTWRQRALIVRGRLFPSQRWLRVHRPGTGESRRRMLITRVQRPFEVLVRIPAAYRERRQYGRRI